MYPVNKMTKKRKEVGRIQHNCEWKKPQDAQEIGVRGSLVVKVTDTWAAYHEFELSAAEDPPYKEAMHVKSVESSIVLPLVWCESSKSGCQLRCRPRHLTMVQNDKVRHQKPSCS
ncbi:uncharacterized protein TNCV_3770441 [Trichonephila clavipes]|nr:uncharacterized protein TNCV_3770441 [Trichonephila clavipes]